MKGLRRIQRSNAFTLVELLVVVTILGILVAVVGVKVVIHQPDKARVKAAMAQIATLKQSLDEYYIETGTFPATEEGLRALVERPTDAEVAANWGGPYMERVPKDPWGRDYVYRCPGADGSDYDIICYGKDGVEGGERFGRDITNHNLDEFR